MTEQYTVDPTTGELLPARPQRLPRPQFSKAGVKLDGARAIDQTAAGRNIDYFNLREHPELDGQKIAMFAIREQPTGEFGDWVMIFSYRVNPDNTIGDPLVIMTGAENVTGRARAAAPEMSQETPVIATLRLTSGGRAWLLE